MVSREVGMKELIFHRLAPAVAVSITGLEIGSQIYAELGDGTKPMAVGCYPGIVGEVYRVMGLEPRFRDLLVVPVPGLNRGCWFLAGPQGMVVSLYT